MKDRERHTPGPWTLDPAEPQWVVKLDPETDTNVPIALASAGFFADGSSAHDYANARLIAAAPEMYRLIHFLLVDGGMPETIRRQDGDVVEPWYPAEQARALLRRIEEAPS